ncbi:MAG: SCO family protein, partial [Gammaproteobacteria bacterium]|nr:SCO family protein [Gammaproteobacteria bacterium]
MINKVFFYAVLLIGSILIVSSCSSTPVKPELKSATLLPAPQVMNDFKLKHFNDGAFNIGSLKNQWSLFFFGYTRCPDVCPTELYMLSEVMKLIEQNPSSVQQSPQVVFVSVDPHMDTLKALAEYAKFYHPSFKGVTGEQKEVDALAKTMGAFYERAYLVGKSLQVIKSKTDVPEGLEDSYLINHSASIVLT